MTGTGAGRLDTASRVSSARHRLHPFLDWPGPIPFAHRGGAGELPENTMPAFAARLAFGEMADALLLASARVEPAALLSSGYHFQWSDLEGALRHLLNK